MRIVCLGVCIGLVFLAARGAGAAGGGAVPRIPVLPGKADWWYVCAMPELGKLAGPDPKRQHVVDHGFIRADNGAWQLWACIRGTAVSRLIYGWEGESLQEGPWRPRGVMVRADAKWGEKVKDGREQAGAPFFIRRRGKVYCFYHSGGFRLMVSDDGRQFERVDLGGGTNRVGIPGARDVMILEHGGRYYAYATAMGLPKGQTTWQSWVSCAVSDDLKTWKGNHVVSKGGVGGVGPVAAESPFVAFLDGYFYLFRSSSMTFKTYVYRSKDPLAFGIDDDSKLVATFRLKAPELVLHDGQWYISDLHRFQGIRMGRLQWKPDGSREAPGAAER